MNFNYFLDSQAAGPEFPFASPRMASPFVPGPVCSTIDAV